MKVIFGWDLFLNGWHLRKAGRSPQKCAVPIEPGQDRIERLISTTDGLSFKADGLRAPTGALAYS